MRFALLWAIQTTATIQGRSQAVAERSIGMVAAPPWTLLQLR